MRLLTAPPATVYVPYAQLTGERSTNLPTTMEIRAAGSLSDVAQAIQQTLQPKLAPDQLRLVSGHRELHVEDQPHGGGLAGRGRVVDTAEHGMGLAVFRRQVGAQFAEPRIDADAEVDLRVPH